MKAQLKYADRRKAPVRGHPGFGRGRAAARCSSRTWRSAPSSPKDIADNAEWREARRGAGQVHRGRPGRKVARRCWRRRRPFRRRANAVMPLARARSASEATRGRGDGDRAKRPAVAGSLLLRSPGMRFRRHQAGCLAPAGQMSGIPGGTPRCPAITPPISHGPHACIRQPPFDALAQRSVLALLEPPILQPADLFLDLAGEDMRRRSSSPASGRPASFCLRPEFTIPVCLHHLEAARPARAAPMPIAARCSATRRTAPASSCRPASRISAAPTRRRPTPRCWPGPRGRRRRSAWRDLRSRMGDAGHRRRAARRARPAARLAPPAGERSARSRTSTRILPARRAPRAANGAAAYAGFLAALEGRTRRPRAPPWRTCCRSPASAGRRAHRRRDRRPLPRAGRARGRRGVAAETVALAAALPRRRGRSRLPPRRRCGRSPARPGSTSARRSTPSTSAPASSRPAASMSARSASRPASAAASTTTPASSSRCTTRPSRTRSRWSAAAATTGC